MEEFQRVGGGLFFQKGMVDQQCHGVAEHERTPGKRSEGPQGKLGGIVCGHYFRLTQSQKLQVCLATNNSSPSTTIGIKAIAT